MPAGLSEMEVSALMQARGGGEGGRAGRAGRGARGSTFAGSPVSGAERQTRRAAVFVVPDSMATPEPRVVEIGLNDWDRTQVVSGLEEGDLITIVGAAQLQAQQQQVLERMRGGFGGGSPFGGRR